MTQEASNVSPTPDEPEPNLDGEFAREEDPVLAGSSYVRDAYEKVPGIGDGRRWYDFPYKILSWLLSSWRRKLLPRRFRDGLNYGLNYLIPFNEHDRHKMWSLEDPLHHITVPEDEHVNVPSIWVVELFPPSEFASLSETIQHNSWDKGRVYFLDRESNREMLERSRSGEGWTWWRLAEIASANSPYWSPDATREKLDPMFGAVELKAIQIGGGLTAVLAHFHLTDVASKSLDFTWHTPQEPQLVRGMGRPRAESREWATYRITQEARRMLHDAARAWMAKRCPGFFAGNSEPQPLMDMLLMDKFDPISGDRTDRELSDALRALGLTGYEVLRRTSPDIPQLLLSPVEGSICPALEPKRTWALWGNRESIASIDEHLAGYGSDTNRAIAHAAHDRMGNFIVLLAVSDFLAVMEAKFAVLRDSARTGHGTFKAKGLQRLRENFLTLSLDLTSVSRDVDMFWRREWRTEGDARFTVDYAPWIKAQDEAEGRKRFTPIDMNDDLRLRHRKWFKQLIAADRDYRDILSTVASLGASVDAFKVGRAALGVALAAMGVALVTLLVTNIGDHTAVGGITSWLGKHFGF